MEIVGKVNTCSSLRLFTCFKFVLKSCRFEYRFEYKLTMNSLYCWLTIFWLASNKTLLLLLNHVQTFWLICGKVKNIDNYMYICSLLPVLLNTNVKICPFCLSCRRRRRRCLMNSVHCSWTQHILFRFW